MSHTLARELEVFIEAHADLAKVAIQILLEESLPPGARAPVVAAVRYGYEDTDIIHDSIQHYGLVDDLFVLAIGVDHFLAAVGEAGARIAAMKLDGVPLGEMLARMKAFGGGSFWEFCRQSTAQFFAQTITYVERNPALIEESRDRFTLEMWNLSRNTTKVTGKLQEEHVRQLIAQYRPNGLPQV